jgi:hypothetical protein
MVGVLWAETHGHDKIRQLKSNSKSKVFFVSPNLTLALLYQQSRRVLLCLGGNEVCCASQCHNYATIHNRIVPYKPSWHLAPSGGTSDTNLIQTLSFICIDNPKLQHT